MCPCLQVLSADYCFDHDGVYPSVNYNPDDPHRSYMEYIDAMPMTAGPGVFGLHENANIACALAETFNIFDTILLMEVRACLHAPDRRKTRRDNVPSMTCRRGDGKVSIVDCGTERPVGERIVSDLQSVI